MNIGVIGTGNIGGTLAAILTKAGHRVLVAGRDRAKAEALATKLGGGATAGSPVDAAAFGEVVAVAVPLRDLPRVADEIAAAARGKVVVDTSNPYPERDCPLAADAVRAGTGTGSWAAGLFPNARVVKGFNTLYFEALGSAGDPAAPSVAVPLASDDAGAAEVVAGLVRDLGFVPVVLPTMADSRRFDVGTTAYGRPLPEADLTRLLSAAPDAAIA